jgi:antitoxin (DNA-binding transcriptional repressor) of toxin-antitoxin stability system
MERAAAGEEIAVTRRGKHYIRLVRGEPVRTELLELPLADAA